jgi:hypothetical protein
MPMVPHSEREMYRAWAKENSRAQMDERGWVYESDYADFMRRPGVEEIRGIIRGWSFSNTQMLSNKLSRALEYAATLPPECQSEVDEILAPLKDRSIRKETS